MRARAVGNIWVLAEFVRIFCAGLPTTALYERWDADLILINFRRLSYSRPFACAHAK